MVDAIILAGGENYKCPNPCTPRSYEALIEIAGKPMVVFVAEALANSKQVNRIYVLGPIEELEQCRFPPKVSVVKGGSSIIETFSLGMDLASPASGERVLVATADIPLLTAEAVDDFLAQCAAVKADVYYPVVAKKINDRLYPGNKKTYLRFKEGTFTGGNLFLINPLIVSRSKKIAEKFIANRKNLFILCRMLGWSFLIRFILGSLSLKDVELRASQLLDVAGAVIQSPYPEIGIDVDKPGDLELVRASFSQ